jgi:trk system potassium uptake protein
MTIKEIREKINLAIYDSKSSVLRFLTGINLVVSFFSIGILVYYYGFSLTNDQKELAFNLIEFSFGFYILRFLIKVFYDFNPIQFLKKNWFESVVMLLLLLEGISYNFLGSLLVEPIFNAIGFTEFADFSMIFIQLFVFIILVNSVFKQRNFKPWMKIHPALLFTLSISVMSFIGGLLLMLPEMSTIKDGLSFTDSMFTAMSSVSVTGLTTIDVADSLTTKGQVVVLILIKLGGLNTIAFGALMLIIAKFGVGIKYHEIIEDFLNKNSVLNASSLLSKILIWATCIEIVGIVLLYFSFGNEGIFADDGNRLFHSVFHGISGFNNAGISTLSGGMMHPDVVANYYVHSIVLILFFLGGLGMIYIFDLFEIKRLRERMKTPWKTIEFSTKISLYFTLIFLFIGAVVFFIFEKNNTMNHDSYIGDLITAFYQSMTTRNAGFNLVETSSLTMPVLIVFLFLMFIGASSGSTGGGIRTSTFAIMWASLVSTIRGKKNTELFKRTISNDTVFKAYAIFLFFVIGNVLGPFVLAISEADLIASGKFDFMDLVFEHVSASCTVGLSTGITSELSEVGKYVIILAMFIGRVGTLTLAYLIGKKVISNRYKYPTGHTMIG